MRGLGQARSALGARGRRPAAELMRCSSYRSTARQLACAVVAVASLAILPGAVARPSYPNLIPWGGLNSCANCHLNPEGGGQRNPFGMAFQQAGFEWNPALAALDSDGDSFANGVEMLNPAGDWMTGDADPGDRHMISSPGRAESVPGERLLTITEVRRSGNGEFFVELSNLSGATQILDRKWFSFGAEFGEGPLPGQLRIVPSGDPETTLAAGAVATYRLDPTGLPAGSFDEINGYVSLILFEDQRGDVPENIDPAFFWLYGDYVEWGPVDKPYNFAASNSSYLPQWDAATGIDAALPPDASFEHDLVTNGVAGWYVASPSLTFGEPRPVAALAKPLGLAFPFSMVGFGTEPLGFESINYAPGWLQSDWPLIQGVVVEPPAAIQGTTLGERSLRLSSLSVEENLVLTNRLFLSGPPTLDEGGLVYSLDIAFEEAPASPGIGDGIDTSRALALSLYLEEADPSEFARSIVLFTSEEAIAVFDTGAGVLFQETLFSFADLDPRLEWVNVSTEFRRISPAQIDIVFTASPRGDEPAGVQAYSWNPAAPFTPDEEGSAAIFALPSGFAFHLNNLFTRSSAPDAQGFAVR
jgi:hypothetical protein